MKREPDVIIRGSDDDALHAEAADGGIAGRKVSSDAVLVQIEFWRQRLHPLRERTVIGLDGFVWHGSDGDSVVHDITENDGKPK